MTIKSILSKVAPSISSKVSVVISSAKALINIAPKTEEEGAERRLKTFGTESKAVAAGVIGVGAATAIAAPLVVAAAGGTKAAVSLAGTQASSAISKAAPVIAQTIVKYPKTSFLIGSGAVIVASSKEISSKDVAQTGVKIGTQYVDLLKETGESIDIYKQSGPYAAFQHEKEAIIENKLAAATIGAVTLGASSAGIYYAGKSIIDAFGNVITPDDKKDKKEIDTILKTNPDIPTPDLPKDIPKDVPSSPVPLTPETIPVGKEVGSSRSTSPRRRINPSKTATSQSLRVNIYNQSRLINTKYLKLAY